MNFIELSENKAIDTLNEVSTTNSQSLCNFEKKYKTLERLYDKICLEKNLLQEALVGKL